MASPLVSRAPNCISCLRRISLCGDIVSLPGWHQTRGKKFVAKAPSSVNVQLLQSIPGYGKKGMLHHSETNYLYQVLTKCRICCTNYARSYEKHMVSKENGNLCDGI